MFFYMKMLCKRLAGLGMVILLLLTISGCRQEKGTYPEFLTGKDWQYNTLVCMEVLHFSDEGNFSYYETCGNPVGDSDLYETYSYDEETGVITVYGYEKGMEEKQIKVLRYTEDSLLVEMEDGIKEFYVDGQVPSLSGDEYEYVAGYSGYAAIISIDGNRIKTASSGYDPDAGGEETIREEKLAEDAVFHELYMETVHTEEEDTASFEYTELTLADAAYSADNSFKIGFVWYNEDLEIEKIVFYGALEIWE